MRQDDAYRVLADVILILGLLVIGIALIWLLTPVIARWIVSIDIS